MNNLDNIIEAKIQNRDNNSNSMIEEEKSVSQPNNEAQDLENLEKLSDCSAEIPSEHEDGIVEQSEKKEQLLSC